MRVSMKMYRIVMLVGMKMNFLFDESSEYVNP